METPITLPKWILIISGIIAIMEILVSIMLCYSPEETLETVDLKAKGVSYVIQMWAVRQFALGIIFGVSVFKKSVPMLLLSYIFLMVMFLGDGMVGVLQKENSLIMMAGLMSLFSVGMIYVLLKFKK